MPILPSTLILALQAHLGDISRRELADLLDVTPATVGNWLSDSVSPTRPQVGRIVRAFADHTAKHLMRAIFEYRRLDPQRSGATWSFGLSGQNATIHKRELQGKHGIYVFYGSGGMPVYLGKSTSCLYTESKARLSAQLNRPVRLPAKVAEAQVGMLARYMSAYEIFASAATKNVESLMLRAFANSLYNRNSGEFSDT